MKTITFIYNTDTEDTEDAVLEARDFIGSGECEPFQIEEDLESFWEAGNDL